MNLHFNCCPEAVREMSFNFGNIENRYGANNLWFTKDGVPFLPVAGELHFSRVPHAEWERALLKMRDTGITVVTTYVFWNYHEKQENVFDFTGDNDVARFLDICKKIKMPCVLRIGPWCHGEVVRGGFPKYVNRMPKKRCDAPKYLNAVRRYWKRLADEIKPYFDGETVIGVQLENEYGGSIKHIHTLRSIAEDAGFKTPFFTMTAWPTNTPDVNFLPMFGGYPEAPWTQNKKPLKPRNRFAISNAKTETEIGEDLNEVQKGRESNFNNFPYASCELGPGNQVTQHRRPIIAENDGYGVGFARFASGINWLGYYMYYGGRNPNDRLMQESRCTGYPNNYPIIDYDFQSPLSRYGECRAHGDRLRLLHLFINSFDTDIAVKQAFFPAEKRVGPEDVSLPSCSVRMDETGAGYFFVSTYERGLRFPDFHDVQIQLQSAGQSIELPAIHIKSGSMFFYPFNLLVEQLKIDYVLAQPLVKTQSDGVTDLYFAEIKGISPQLCINGEKTDLPVNKAVSVCENIRITVLSKPRAMQLHLADGKVFFADGTAYTADGKAYCETVSGFLETGSGVVHAEQKDLRNSFTLSEIPPVRLPHGYYLYSHGKRRYYKLRFDKNILKDKFDIRLCFAFTGLNLQVFSGETLLNDYFNTDGNFVMRLGEYRKYIEHSGELIIKAAPATHCGVGHVYNEIDIPAGKISLTLSRADEVQVLSATL